MPYSVRKGPMVGEHVEHAEVGFPQEAVKLMSELGCTWMPTPYRVERLKVGECLRFDTYRNTGVSVCKTAHKPINI